MWSHCLHVACRPHKKEIVDLDLIEKILDATEEDGLEKVHVKFRGTVQPLFVLV